MHGNTDLLHKGSCRIVHCGVHSGAKPGFPVHSHPVWEITVHCQGKIRTLTGNATFETFPGTILLHAPGRLHWESATEPYRLLYIMFECADLEDPGPILNDDADRSLELTCRAIIREWRGQAPYHQELTDLLGRQMVMLIRRLTATQPRPESEQLTRAAAAIIEERFNQPLTLSELCKELSTTVAKLRKEFMQARGQTPNDYLQAVRLRHAIASLQSTDLKLESIAHVAGYNSASHLTRHIKAATGRTPGQLRRQQSQNP